MPTIPPMRANTPAAITAIIWTTSLRPVGPFGPTYSTNTPQTKKPAPTSMISPRLIPTVTPIAVLYRSTQIMRFIMARQGRGKLDDGPLAFMYYLPGCLRPSEHSLQGKSTREAHRPGPNGPGQKLPAAEDERRA